MGQVRRTGRSLTTGFAWTFAGNAVNGFSQWAILAIVARLGSSEVLGQYALAIAVATPIAMLAHLNLRSVLVTDIANRHPFSDYLKVRYLAALAGLLATIAVGVFWNNMWPVGVAIMLAGTGLAAESLEDLYYGVLQRQERLDQIAKSMLLRSVLSIGAVAFLVITWANAAGAAAGFAAGRVLTLLLYDARVGRQPREPEQSPALVFRSALPLGMGLMLIALTATIPRYVVEGILGPAVLGGFAAVASFVTVGSTAMNALGQSFTTRLARAWAAGDRARFWRLTWVLVALAGTAGLTGALIAFAVGDVLLRAVYRVEFAGYQPLLVRIMLAGTLMYIAAVLGFVITSTRRFSDQLRLLLAVTAASGLASALAVPALGLNGAVLALAFSAAVQISGQLLILRKVS